MLWVARTTWSHAQLHCWPKLCRKFASKCIFSITASYRQPMHTWNWVSCICSTFFTSIKVVRWKVNYTCITYSCTSRRKWIDLVCKWLGSKSKVVIANKGRDDSLWSWSVSAKVQWRRWTFIRTLTIGATSNAKVARNALITTKTWTSLASTWIYFSNS